MRRTYKKFISIFLLLIIFVAQFSPVLATEAPKNLTQYLIENGLDENNDGTLSGTEWAKVKELNIKSKCVNDLTGIENAVNLEVLELNSIDISNVDLSKLTKLNELTLDYCDIGNNEVLKLPNIEWLSIKGINPNKIDFTKLTKLTILDISSYELEDKNITDLVIPELVNLKSFEIDGLAYKNVDISKLKNLEGLAISNMREDVNIKFPSLESLGYLSIYEGIGNSKLDLSKSNKLVYAYMIDKNIKEKIIYPTTNKYIYISENQNLDGIYVIGICASEDITLQVGARLFFFDYLTPVRLDKVRIADNEILGAKFDNGYVYAKKVGTTKVEFNNYNNTTCEINVTVIDNKPDKTLENSNITSKFINASGNNILKSNGELWEINSETTAERIDTNVKKFVSNDVYALKDNSVDVALENTLYLDKKLKISAEYGDYEKIINNVENAETNKYLTKDGDLYGIYINYITKEIKTDLVMKNVKKIINENYIVKEDGTTWWDGNSKENYGGDSNVLNYNVEYSKILDVEIKECISKVKRRDQYGIEYYCDVLVDTNGTEWICENNVWRQVNDTDKLTDRTSYYSSVLTLENGNVYHKYWDFDNSEDNDTSRELLLTNVVTIKENAYSTTFIRTDGSIWLYSEQYGLYKVTKSTAGYDEEPSDKIEDEIYLNKDKDAKTKDIGGTTKAVSGLNTNLTVESLKDNFSSEFTAKVFDKNNNEVTGNKAVGTGAKVVLYKNDVKVKEYYVVIYGDTDGTGTITAVDALAIIKDINGKIKFTNEAFTEAGRVRNESTEELSAVDALAIIKNLNGKFTINQNK